MGDVVDETRRQVASPNDAVTTLTEHNFSRWRPHPWHTADVVVSLENRLVAVATKDGLDIPDAELKSALTKSGYDVKAIARTVRTINDIRAELKVKSK